MSLERKVVGGIPLKEDPGVADAVAQLIEGVDDQGFTCTTDDGQLWIESHTTSWWTSERIDELLPAFVSRWGSEPATLETETGSEREDWILCPAGFDPTEAAIANIDAQIEALQQQRATLVAKKPK